MEGKKTKLSLDKLCFLKSFIHEICMHQFTIDCVIFSKYNKEQEDKVPVFRALTVYGTDRKQINIEIKVFNYSATKEGCHQTSMETESRKFRNPSMK